MSFIVIVSEFFIYLNELEKLIDNNEFCIYYKLPTLIEKLSPIDFEKIDVLYSDDDKYSFNRANIFVNKITFSGFAKLIKDISPNFMKKDRFVLKVIS